MTEQKQISNPIATIDRIALKKNLSTARRVIEKRNTIPILSQIILEADADSGQITTRATDLDIWIEQKLEAEISASFQIAVQPAALAAVATYAHEPVNVCPNGEKLTMRAGFLISRLRMLCEAQDFPQPAKDRLQELDKAPEIEVSQSDLHRLLHLGHHCITSEGTRYYLNGTFLTKNPETGNLRAVTTDGHRMAVIDSQVFAPDPPDIIIPRKAVDLLLFLTKPGNNLPVKISFSEQMVRFRIGDIEVISKVIDGTYPDYQRVIPQGETTTTFNLTQHAVTQVTAISNALRSPAYWSDIILDGKAGHLICENRSDDHDAIVPLQAHGEGQIAMNGRYLSAQMKVTPTANLKMTTSSNPAILVSEDPDAFWVIMPKRLVRGGK